MIGLKKVFRFLTNNTSLSTSMVNHPIQIDSNMVIVSCGSLDGLPPYLTHLLQNSNHHYLTCSLLEKKEPKLLSILVKLAFPNLTHKILSIKAFSQLRYHLFLT